MSEIPAWLEALAEGLTLSIMLVSLAAMIVPIFPGILIIWLAGLVYGAIAGFEAPGWVVLVVMTVLAIGGSLADNVLMGTKAREQGAAWSSILLALTAAVIGTFLFPPIGGLLASPLVLYLFEKRRLGDRNKALKITKALVIGWGWALVVRVLLGMAMIGLWAIWALSN